MSHTLDLWDALTDQAIGFVVGVLAEECGKLAVGGEGGLDRYDYVGGEVGNAGDCREWSVLLSRLLVLSQGIAGQRMRTYLLRPAL